MLLQLKEVFVNEGRRLDVGYSLPMNDFDINGDYPFKSPVEVSASAVNRASLVELKVKAVFDYTKLAQTLVDDGNDDYIETPDYTLELDEVVISDIVLNLPSKILCREDCKGICPECGKNLNHGDCNCNKTPVDSRLEILKQLIDD